MSKFQNSKIKMIAKFAVVMAFVAVAYAVPQYVGVAPVAPVAYRPQYYETYPDTPPKYEFSYEVNDPTTGDSHGHQEARDGDVTQGFYALIEADGTKRIVEYTVNGPSGFQAVVRKEGTPYNGGVAPVRPAYVQPAYVQPAYVQPAYRPPAYVQPAYRPVAPATYATTARY